MKEVIIHVGFHKTATTSIQGTCYKNKDKLQNLGFYFPIFELKNCKITNHSLPFDSIFRENLIRQKPTHNQLGVTNKEANQIYLKYIDKFLREEKNKILISGESISGMNISELTALKSKLESQNRHVRVIALIRSPLSFMNSMVQQNIKTGHYKKSIVDKTIIQKIENLKNVFSDVSFFPFSEACQNEKGPVGYFLNKIGIPQNYEFEIVKKNESYSNKAIRLINYMHQKCPYYIGNKPNPLRNFKDIHSFSLIKGKKFSLNETEFNDFKDIIESENEYLKHNLGEEFCDPDLSKFKYEPDPLWSDSQVEQLRQAVSPLNYALKAIIKDYCQNIIFLDKERISYIFSDKKEVNIQAQGSETMQTQKPLERAKKNFEEGNQFQEQGNLEESIASYQQAIKIKPDYAQPLFKLAKIYESQENWNEAVKCYRRSIGLKFDNHIAHLKLAKVLVKQNKIYGAISAYQEAIELKSDLPALVYKELGDLLLQDKSDADTALAMYQQAADKKEDWNAYFYIKYADTLLERKLVDRAIVFYQKGIKLQNDNPRYYLSLGDALGQKQELDKAIACYQKVIQLKPDSVGAYKKLGDMYQAKEDYDSATGCYHKSLEIKPEATYIYRSLGNVLSKQGNQEEAERCYSLSGK